MPESIGGEGGGEHPGPSPTPGGTQGSGMSGGTKDLGGGGGGGRRGWGSGLKGGRLPLPPQEVLALRHHGGCTGAAAADAAGDPRSRGRPHSGGEPRGCGGPRGGGGGSWPPPVPAHQRDGGRGEGGVSAVPGRDHHGVRGVLPHAGAGLPQPAGCPGPGGLHLPGGALRAVGAGGLPPRRGPHRRRPGGAGLRLRPLPHGHGRLHGGRAGARLLRSPRGLRGAMKAPGSARRSLFSLGAGGRDPNPNLGRPHPRPTWGPPSLGDPPTSRSP